jgi:hypothetical protein
MSALSTRCGELPVDRPTGPLGTIKLWYFQRPPLVSFHLLMGQVVTRDNGERYRVWTQYLRYANTRKIPAGVTLIEDLPDGPISSTPPSTSGAISACDAYAPQPPPRVGTTSYMQPPCVPCALAYMPASSAPFQFRMLFIFSGLRPW